VPYAPRAPRALTIGIPLRSARTTPDWPFTCQLLERTLASIANQSESCARVIIACHEIPELSHPTGLAVEYIQAPFEPPRDVVDSDADGLRKKQMIGEAHRRDGGGPLFLLDADDLLETEFVATIARSAAKAMVIKRGFRLDYTAGSYTILPRFWRLCGSCAVVDWDVDELPTAAVGPDVSPFQRFLDTRHFNWPELFEQWGWRVDYIDRPIMMYVLNHGQNVSMAVNKRSLKWLIYLVFFPKRKLNKEILGRFGLGETF
jgi:hypothetical protein